MRKAIKKQKVKTDLIGSAMNGSRFSKSENIGLEVRSEERASVKLKESL